MTAAAGRPAAVSGDSQKEKKKKKKKKKKKISLTTFVRLKSNSDIKKEGHNS